MIASRQLAREDHEIGPPRGITATRSRREGLGELDPRSADRQGQLPPPWIACGVLCPAHCNWQVAPAPQLTEHELVQATEQLPSVPHDTLPLSPTVTWQLEFGWQLMLQDLPHEPEQLLWSEHSSVQLDDEPHELLKSHWAPDAQVQLAPEQLGGTLVPFELPPPHADAHKTRIQVGRKDITPPSFTVAFERASDDRSCSTMPG